MQNIYCGFNSTPPPGKKFGTPEQCVKQYRRYGLIAVPAKKPKVLNKQTELVKLKKLEFKLKGIQKKFNNFKTSKDPSKYKSKMETLQKRYKLWHPRYIKQKAIYESIK